MATITIRVPDDIHEKYMSMCRERGVKASTVHRNLIIDEVHKVHKPKEFRVVENDLEPEDLERKKVYCWLTDNEIAACGIHASHHGGTRSGWIAAVLRSALTRSPVLYEGEVKAMSHCNYELGRANRLLKIAMEKTNTTPELLQDKIVDCLKAMNNSASQSDQLVKSASERWALK